MVIVTGMSQRVDSSMAFLSRPAFRLENVACLLRAVSIFLIWIRGREGAALFGTRAMGHAISLLMHLTASRRQTVSNENLLDLDCRDTVPFF